MPHRKILLLFPVPEVLHAVPEVFHAVPEVPSIILLFASTGILLVYPVICEIVSHIFFCQKNHFFHNHLHETRKALLLYISRVN